MENRYKVLIADDDAHISELIALYMEKEGYEINTAALWLEEFYANL